MKRANIRKLSDILKDFLKENKLDARLKERQVINGWEELMGKAIARVTKKIYIKEGRLFVIISSSVVRSELHMLKQEIVRKLNERAGEEIIRELVLK